MPMLSLGMTRLSMSMEPLDLDAARGPYSTIVSDIKSNLVYMIQRIPSVICLVLTWIQERIWHIRQQTHGLLHTSCAPLTCT